MNATELDDAVVALSHVLAQQIPELHRKFELNRPLATDTAAAELVTGRQVIRGYDRHMTDRTSLVEGGLL